MNPSEPTPPDPTQSPAPAPQQPQPYQPTMKNPLAAMREGEQIIFEVRRHPFGLIGMYVSFGLLLVIILAVTFIAPSVLPDYNANNIREIGMIALLLAVILVGIFGFVAHIVYYGNSWILSSDSLTQITQNSLFDKQNSQLSLGNLEDISAHQDGILAHMFNFGTLKVETAGEHSKFSFPFCPDPNKRAQQILVQREAFEQGEHLNNNGVNTNTQ